MAKAWPVGEFAAIDGSAVLFTGPVPAGVFVVPEVVEEEFDALLGDGEKLNLWPSPARCAEDAV